MKFTLTLIAASLLAGSVAASENRRVYTLAEFEKMQAADAKPAPVTPPADPVRVVGGSIIASPVAKVEPPVPAVAPAKQAIPTVAKVEPAAPPTPVAAPVKQTITPTTPTVIAETPKDREQVIPEKELKKARAPIPLSDRVRLEASRRWEESGVADALVGLGGQVEYAYGQSRPTITCAPLHVCTIRLMAGESITSLSIGDSVRWLAQSTTAGERPVIVVKPTQDRLSTNLVVTTDAGRVYYMHLVSSKSEYVPMISFYDPAAMVTDLRKQAETETLRKMALESARERAIVAPVGKGFDPANLDFGYTCKGDAAFKPVRVFANATHTYLQMPESMKSGDAPAIFNLSSGETELLNTRLTNGYYIVDGKPAKLKLVVGVGGKERFVECSVAKSGGWWSPSAGNNDPAW